MGTLSFGDVGGDSPPLPLPLSLRGLPMYEWINQPSYPFSIPPGPCDFLLSISPLFSTVKEGKKKVFVPFLTQSNFSLVLLSLRLRVLFPFLFPVLNLTLHFVFTSIFSCSPYSNIYVLVPVLWWAFVECWLSFLKSSAFDQFRALLHANWRFLFHFISFRFSTAWLRFLISDFDPYLSHSWSFWVWESMRLELTVGRAFHCRCGGFMLVFS